MIHRKVPSRHKLGREIAVVLVVKVLALAALYAAFFGPSHRPQVTPETMERVILGALVPASESVSPPTEHRRNVHHV